MRANWQPLLYVTHVYGSCAFEARESFRQAMNAGNELFFAQFGPSDSIYT